MSYVEIIEIEGQTMQGRHAVLAALGDEPVDGQIASFTGPTPAGVRMVTVWESKAHHDRFITERLHPAFERAGTGRLPMTAADFEAEDVYLAPSARAAS